MAPRLASIYQNLCKLNMTHLGMALAWLNAKDKNLDWQHKITVTLPEEVDIRYALWEAASIYAQRGGTLAFLRRMFQPNPMQGEWRSLGEGEQASSDVMEIAVSVLQARRAFCPKSAPMTPEAFNSKLDDQVIRLALKHMHEGGREATDFFKKMNLWPVPDDAFWILATRALSPKERERFQTVMAAHPKGAQATPAEILMICDLHDPVEPGEIERAMRGGRAQALISLVERGALWV